MDAEQPKSRLGARGRRWVLATAMLVLFAVGLGVFVAPFAFPTPPPLVTRFLSTKLFSPNGDTRRDRARIAVRLSQGSQVSVAIRNGERAIVRRILVDERRPRGWVRLAWDGYDDRHQLVPNGKYVVELHARSGKKRWNASRRMEIDTLPPVLASFGVASRTLTGPGRGECRASATAANPGAMAFEAVSERGARVAERAPRAVRAGGRLGWDWSARTAPAGLYRIRASLTGAAGNRSQAVTTCWVAHVTGEAVPTHPAPGQRVGVRLRAGDGARLAGSTPVRLAVFRRVGTPGRGTGAVLGRRYGARVGGTLRRARLTLPRHVRPSALWLVAITPRGTALLPL